MTRYDAWRTREQAAPIGDVLRCRCGEHYDNDDGVYACPDCRLDDEGDRLCHEELDNGTPGVYLGS